MTVKLLMSACLVGQCCRYDARTLPSVVDKRLHVMLNIGEVAVLCPECAGGLDTPREAAEIEPGKTAQDVLDGKARVLTKTGADVTEAYVKGAEQFVALAKKYNVNTAVLKSKSPSCSTCEVYDGTHTGKCVPGLGVAACALKNAGVTLFDETEVKKALDFVENK